MTARYSDCPAVTAVHRPSSHIAGRWLYVSGSGKVRPCLWCSDLSALATRDLMSIVGACENFPDSPRHLQLAEALAELARREDETGNQS